jgi:hypothetical protein
MINSQVVGFNIELIKEIKNIKKGKMSKWKKAKDDSKEKLTSNNKQNHKGA